MREKVGEGKKFKNYRMLAELVGTPPNTFTYWQQEKIKNPSPELLRKTSLALTGDKDYLPKVFAEAHLGIKALTNTEYQSLHNRNPRTSGLLPVLTPQNLEQDKESFLCAEDNRQTNEYIPNPLMNQPVSQRPAFAFRAPDDSMSPRYLRGDFLIVCARKDTVENSPVLFRTKNSPARCRLWKQSQSTLLFFPTNPDYDTIVCPQEEVLWMFPVTAMYRKEGTVP